MSNRYGQVRGRAKPRGSRADRPDRTGLIVKGAVAVVVLLVALGIVLGVEKEPPESHVVWLAEKSTRAPGGIPDKIRERVRELGAKGGGELVAYAIGERAERAGEMPLAVMHDGDPEPDDARRTKVLDTRLDDLATRMADVAVSRSGFSLYAALRTAADAAAERDGRVEVWFSTTLFTGSVPPLAVGTLTAADPGAAADQLVGAELSGLDLGRVDLHPVLLDPIGPDQQPLGPVEESWRTAFVEQLGTGLRATVADPLHDSTSDPAWSKASQVSAVPLFAPPPTKPAQPGRVDNLAFHPDSPDLLDAGVTKAQLGSIVEKIATGSYDIRITGYCARFGDPAGARDLSKRRADVIAGLLADSGVARASITTDGAGFDRRGDASAPPDSPAQRVVVIDLLPR
ncbi:hypothetical protein GCM10022243_18610 [Saccharothrix violaceirubra]|uniref:Outer membrane protein OmpA-like peptidoglycan-associated protein n=1 Tax=Saccharothrix violaceirubra TaxID=413306 RepID=A0A7W7T3B2_9PSEU|nr:OmpA family protein [Saccharothrix violaceirubra]MBB4965232.1 outer membrane protein OmpA-like peptidoglycan-associated protein [Saccharothrix violaceirubra]